METEVTDYPKYFKSQQDAETHAQTVQGYMAYVIFSNQGRYMVDLVYDIYSDETLISTWYNGKKQ